MRAAAEKLNFAVQFWNPYDPTCVRTSGYLGSGHLEDNHLRRGRVFRLSEAAKGSNVARPDALQGSGDAAFGAIQDTNNGGFQR